MMNIKIYLYSIVFSVMNYGAFSQQAKDDTCNQFTDGSDKYKKMIPKEFCMPKGYLCYYFISDIDLTADGKKDLIIHWRKKRQVDGDTTFVSIYQRINDSTLVHKSTLSNLYALYFKEYDLSYHIENPKLDKIQEILAISNVEMFDVQFRKSQICVSLFTEAQAGVDVFFNYNVQKKNWYLTKEVYWFGDNLRVEREIRETKIIKNGIAIQMFNMFDYLDN